MNIFEIFCEGDGKINEANMSSALHFLLNPKAPHGFHVTALSEFLSPIADQLKSLCDQKHVINPYRTFALGSFLRSFENIIVKLEEPVLNPNPQPGLKNRRDIDLVIEFFNDFKSKQPSFVIAIENKIKEESANENQIIDEYEFLRAQLNTEYAATETENQIHIPIIFIYLTRTILGQKTGSEWTSLNLLNAPSETKSDFKVHYSWQPNASNNASIVSLIKNLINKEQSGSINPASSYSSLFLRSMLNFINNDFDTESRKDEEELEKSPATQHGEDMSSEDFWQHWQNEKSTSLPYAKQLYEKVSCDFLNYFKATPKFTKSRVSFYFDKVKYGAILFEGKTSKKWVEVQIDRTKDHDITTDLQNRCETAGIEINDRHGNFNLYVPIEADFIQVSALIDELIQKLLEVRRD